MPPLDGSLEVDNATDVSNVSSGVALGTAADGEELGFESEGDVGMGLSDCSTRSARGRTEAGESEDVPATSESVSVCCTRTRSLSYSNALHCSRQPSAFLLRLRQLLAELRPLKCAHCSRDTTTPWAFVFLYI